MAGFIACLKVGVQSSRLVISSRYITPAYAAMLESLLLLLHPSSIFLSDQADPENIFYTHIRCHRQPENVDFRRNGMSFFGGQHAVGMQL